jgi:hypothetical protein
MSSTMVTKEGKERSIPSKEQLIARRCEALGEYAFAEAIRKILTMEQEHQIDLATALGIDVPEI